MRRRLAFAIPAVSLVLFFAGWLNTLVGQPFADAFVWLPLSVACAVVGALLWRARAGGAIAALFIYVGIAIPIGTLLASYANAAAARGWPAPEWAAWLFQVSRPAGRPKEGAFLPGRGGIFRILSLIAAVLVMAGLMNVLGFQLAMFAFLVFTLLVLGKQPVWLTLVIAIGGSVGVYRLFSGYLDVELPKSALAFLAALGL